MAQRNLKGTVGRPLAPDLGTTALNLVYHGAEVFSSMEDHAREAEARAYSICKSAAEGLNLAEQRIEAAESARREADCELLETSRALKQAQSRIEAAEDKLTALEFRAQAAEAEAREAKKALALIEEAIRTRLLRGSPEDKSSLGEGERNSVSSGRYPFKDSGVPSPIPEA